MNRSGLFTAASGLGLLMSAGVAIAAPASPSGGSVVAGSASIAASGASMTISQSTPKAIIDWSSFSIGQGGSVQFNNGTGATLNRVTGTPGSSIDGLLSATGSIYLINPNGVIVGKSGEVKVGGSFVASTLDIPNSSFLAGGALTFSGPSTAAVVNEGKVGSLGGDVVLIAASVTNAGSLSAPNGTAGLLAGRSVLLRDQALDGGKFSVLIGDPSTSAANSGLIEAANAELRANGGNVYALAGNTAGVIRATGVKAGDGHVWLMADGGALDVAGTITARGPNGSGGSIETSGAEVKIGASSIDAGVGGTWLVDPYDLTVDSTAASSISGALNAGTNVVEQTTASGASGYGNQNPSGNGDIFVAAPISWSTGAQLTLDAYRNIVVTAPITVSGAGKVALNTGSGGHLDFGLGATGFTGRIDFTGAEGGGQSLAINGQGYNLIYSMAELAALDGSAGRNVLAVSLTPAGGYSTSVVASFSGTLEGLGHTINNLNVLGGGSNQGLIGQLQAGGVIADLGVSGGAIYAYEVGGGLVGFNAGTIARSFATDSVTVSYRYGGGGGVVGGLAGQNTGTITDSFAAGLVGTANSRSADLGGLVGSSSGSIINSHATGDVFGGDQSASLGGLAGYSSGSITTSYATGQVKGTADSILRPSMWVGGLVGYDTGSISLSYATGSVTGDQNIGGLVGWLNGGAVSDTFATGYINTNYSNDAWSGGLIGQMSAGSVVRSYSTGMVASKQHKGGFMGDFESGALSDNYWNTQTSGVGFAISGITGSPTLPTGLTTTQLQSGLPSGFSSSVWGLIAGTSFPYQLALFPTTPQVISGHVYRYAAASGVFSGRAVVATVNGSTTVGRTMSAADGSYYFITPGGTLPAGSTFLEHLDDPAARATTVIEHVAAGASLTGLNLNGGVAAIYTPDTTLSATTSDLAAGLGSVNSNGVLLGVSGGQITDVNGGQVHIFAQGSGFDFDHAWDLSLSSPALVLTASGAVTQSVGPLKVAELQGSSVGGMSLTSAGNMIGQLHGWTDPSGAISLVDAEGLTVNYAVNGASAVSLTTTAGDLAVTYSVVGGAGGVILQSAGKVTEAGVKAAVRTVTGTLSVTAVGGIGMDGANIGHSVSLSNSGGGTLHYTALGNLGLAAATNAGAGPIVLTTTLNPSNFGTITLNGLVSGGAVTLNAAAAIKEMGAGAIDATLLQGSAAGAVTLNGSNMIAKINGFTATGGAFSLKDGETLTIAGGSTLDGTGQTVSLTTTSGDIAVNGTVKAATLNLTSQAGALTESNSAGAIIAGTLNATAHTGITLASPGNDITTVGTDHTDSGPNTIVQ